MRRSRSWRTSSSSSRCSRCVIGCRAAVRRAHGGSARRRRRPRRRHLDGRRSSAGATRWRRSRAELDTAHPTRCNPSDIATLVYTSGTTGPPKAVMATHGNLIAAINALGPIVDLSADDRVLSYLPLAHILERLNSEVRLYCAGNALWFAASIAEMPAELRDLRPTCFVGVPRVWEKMAATINAAIDAMPSRAPPPGALGDRRRGAGCRSRSARRAARRRRSGCAIGSPIAWCCGGSASKPVSTRRTR